MKRVEKFWLALCLSACNISFAFADVGNLSAGSSSYSSSSSGSSGSFSISGLIFLVIVAIVGFFVLKAILKNRSNSVMTNIKKDYPAFAEDKFVDFTRKVFTDLNEAWESGDWKKIRGFECSQLFSEHYNQLESLKQNGEHNIIHCKNISIHFADYFHDGWLDVIVMRIDVPIMSDYLVDDDGKVKGTKSNFTGVCYELTFISDNALRKQGRSLLTESCPMCGAPNEADKDGKCPYCDHVIVDEKCSWVLARYDRKAGTRVD